MATSAGKLSMENANAMITVRGSEEERPWSLSGRLQAVTHENPTGDAEDGETTIRLGLGDAQAEVRVSPAHAVELHD